MSLSISLALGSNQAAVSGGGTPFPASLGANRAIDFTSLSLANLYTDTGATTNLTTDLQTVRAFKDPNSGIIATNATGWVYHANSGKPYLLMDNSSDFVIAASTTYADANGQHAIWVTANISSSGLNDLVDMNGVRVLLAATSVPTTNSWILNSAGAQLAQDSYAVCPLNTDAVFSTLTTGSSGTGTVASFVDNVGNGSPTAWTGTPEAASIEIQIGNPAGGKFYGLLIAKGDQTANRSVAQTYMAALHP